MPRRSLLKLVGVAAVSVGTAFAFGWSLASWFVERELRGRR